MLELIPEVMRWILLLKVCGAGFFILVMVFVRVYDSTRHSRRMLKEDIESMKTMFDLEDALKDFERVDIQKEIILASGGCVVKVSDAHEWWAKRLGKHVGELSEVDKVSAILNWILEEKHLPSLSDDNLENGCLPEVGTDDDGRQEAK